MVDKFGKWDRKRVIHLIQDTYQVTLKVIGSREIWYRDESGTEWWVIGGIGEWYGIPSEMMEYERVGTFAGNLVFAQKLSDSLNVFVGSLQTLVEARNSLSRTQENSYHFNVRVKVDCARIVEARGVFSGKSAHFRIRKQIEILTESPLNASKKLANYLHLCLRTNELILSRTSIVPCGAICDRSDSYAC